MTDYSLLGGPQSKRWVAMGGLARRLQYIVPGGPDPHSGYLITNLAFALALRCQRGKPAHLAHLAVCGEGSRGVVGSGKPFFPRVRHATRGTSPPIHGNGGFRLDERRCPI